MYLIDYMPFQYHYLFRVYFSMRTFFTSFRNKLYLQQQKQSASHSSLFPFLWALISPSFPWSIAVSFGVRTVFMN